MDEKIRSRRRRQLEYLRKKRCSLQVLNSERDRVGIEITRQAQDIEQMNIMARAKTNLAAYLESAFVVAKRYLGSNRNITRVGIQPAVVTRPPLLREMPLEVESQGSLSPAPEGVPAMTHEIESSYRKLPITSLTCPKLAGHVVFKDVELNLQACR